MLLTTVCMQLRDIESVWDHMKEYYASKISMDVKEAGAYINEHGRLLAMGIFRTYPLDVGDRARGILPFNSFWNQSIVQRRLARDRRQFYHHYLSIELPRKDLTWAYYAICHYVQKNQVQIQYQKSQHYVPGSILTVHGQALVGGVQDKSQLSQWNVCWREPSCSSENCRMFIFCLPSTDCGSIVVDPLLHPCSEFKGNTIPILCAGTVPHYLEIYLHSSGAMSRSWIAQASHLDTSLRSRGCIDEDGLYQINGGFSVQIEPLDKHGEHFHLCDTFMVEDTHTLLLFIRPPVVDYSSHKILAMPVLSWLYDGDSEISLEEAEEVFAFKLITSWDSWPSPCSSVYTAIPELNADYGFDPVRGGTDVCEQHGWPVLELFDMSKSLELEEWTTSDVVSQSLEPESTIISEGARQTLREQISLAGSPQGDVKYMAVERIEEVDANEAETKMKITAAVQRNMYPRYSELLIVVVTAISTLMLTLIPQVYLY
ncbi:hypothetical protein IW262DRAFT_350514 [Armillaria fumosa]|nr:hypothetical protein IW262DRAFT_350514 [Armillaria fumosa]